MTLKNSLSKFLNKPYPFYYRGKSLLILGISIFLLAFLFNYFFTPFNVDLSEHKMHFFWISLIHSGMPIIILILLYPFIHFMPGLDENWSIGKDFVFLGCFLLLIGIGQFLIRDLIYNNPNNWSWGYFREEIGNTFLVGILLVGIIISLNYNRLNARYAREAIKLDFSSQKFKKTNGQAIIPIETLVKMDRFELEVHTFLFAKAEGNYVMLYLKKGKELSRILKRISIKELEKQLGAIDQIDRTHRSYIVNLSFLEHVKGNAQGYQLTLQHGDSTIPVSRNMIPVFETRLQQ